MAPILRLHDVKARCALSKTTIYRLIESGLFPKPIRLGPNSVGWLSDELDKWVTDRAAARTAATSRSRR